MSSIRSRLPDPRDHRGGVLALTAIILTVILLIAAYVIDEGIWFVHRQHLQTQADASALAAAHDFQYPCTPGGAMDQSIASTVYQYDGTTLAGFNQQVWATPISGPDNPPLSAYSNTQHNLFSVINRPDYFNQAIPDDTDLSGTTGTDGSPCSDAAIDVKLSETNLPSVFPFGNPAYINAQARVSIEKLTASAGAEPFVEPFPTPIPSSITASLVDESNNNSPVAGPVTLTASSTNPTTFTGQFGQFTFPSLTAGDTGISHSIGLKLCYQSGSCYETGGGPQGVTYMRDWADSTSISAPPQVGNIAVVPDPKGSPACSSPNNFISTPSACTVVVVASNVTFPTVGSPTCGNNGNVSLSLVVGTASPVTFPCPSGSLTNATWTSSPVTVNESTGLSKLAINWATMAGAKPTGASGGNTANPPQCGDGKGQDPPPCTGTIDAPNNSNGSDPVTQRINSGAFSSTDASTSNSGSIIGVSLTDPNGNQIMSVPQSTSEQSAAVSVTVLGFQPSSTFGSTPIELSFGGNQANAAIGCNGNSVGSPQFFQAMVSGCTDVYQTQPSPGSCATPLPTPPNCAKENPGNGKLGQDLAKAMNCKINGSGQTSGLSCQGGNPTTCVNPNHWTAGPNQQNPQTVNQVLSASPADPRLVQLLITGSAQLVNGAQYVPVLAIADFYVTGWSGGDPCIGPPNPTPPCSPTNTQGCGQSANGLYYTGDDSPPGGASAPSGILMGHWVQYTVVNTGGQQGGGTCVQGTLTDCGGFLTK